MRATSRLHQVSEEDDGEATVAEVVPDPAGSHGKGADVFADEPWTGRSTLYSPSTRRRRVHDRGPMEHLLSSADRAR